MNEAQGTVYFPGLRLTNNSLIDIKPEESMHLRIPLAFRGGLVLVDVWGGRLQILFQQGSWIEGFSLHV